MADKKVGLYPNGRVAIAYTYQFHTVEYLDIHSLTFKEAWSDVQQMFPLKELIKKKQPTVLVLTTFFRLCDPCGNG